MSRTASILAVLRRYESRNVTFIAPDGSWPVVWTRAKAMHVWDADGRKYLDLTAAFGVAAAGHANLRVVRAGQRQMGRLAHAMGDVHPHPVKAALARELSRVTFERWSRGSELEEVGAAARAVARTGRGVARTRAAGRVSGKVIFCNSGFEAVEAALKTALLATGKPGVVAFEGGYHGLGYGTLNTTHRAHFRGPFRAQLAEFGHFAPFPCSAEEAEAAVGAVEGLLRRRRVGAVLVEPGQARGGIRFPPPSFLPALREVCDREGALLVLDEVYTGFGRTGAWFGCELTGTVPDLICLGKALTGGFPLSACVGRADLMDAAWPESTGEAIHTSTYLGHPVGCAMALAQIDEIRSRRLVARSRRLGTLLGELLRAEISHPQLRVLVRGRGLMAGVELAHPDGRPATAAALAFIKRLLHLGFILLPEGEQANVIALTPPLIITETQLRRAVGALREVLSEWPPGGPGRSRPRGTRENRAGR